MLDVQYLQPNIHPIALTLLLYAFVATIKVGQQGLGLYLRSPCIFRSSAIVIGLLLDLLKGVVPGRLFNELYECLEFLLEVVDSDLFGIIMVFFEEMPHVLVEMTDLHLQQFLTSQPLLLIRTHTSLCILAAI